MLRVILKSSNNQIIENKFKKSTNLQKKVYEIWKVV